MQVWRCHQGAWYMQAPERIQHPQEERRLCIWNLPVPPAAGIPELQPVPFPELQEAGHGILQEHVLPVLK